jgi:DNA-binding transcriptional regulator LsrR (DeoR family)
MPHKKISEIEMQAVAYLYSKNHSREEIRHILKLSQPSVSRSIKQAMQKGWLKSTVQFVEESIPDGRLQEIDALVSPQQKLIERFKEFARNHKIPIVPDIRVLPSANRHTDADLWQERLEQFGNLAAAHIRELLLPAQKCGISWGHTILSIARGLRKLGPSPLIAQRRAPITFIALCGEPLSKPRGEATTQISSSSLAEQFTQIINDSPKHSYTLSAVPAIILEDNEKNAGIIHDFFKRSATEYCQIFYGDSENGQPALIDELDIILTSVGAPTYPHGYWGDSLIATKGIDWERIKRLIIGDIGGVLFPRPGLGINEKEELQKLNDRWMGIKERHMKQCAEKASDNRTAGVIVVAIGKNKAASVSESIRLGLVNTLIIDHDLADALLQEL